MKNKCRSANQIDIGCGEPCFWLLITKYDSDEFLVCMRGKYISIRRKFEVKTLLNECGICSRM